VDLGFVKMGAATKETSVVISEKRREFVGHWI
jgi:hypothetical protein